jgi:hypothetical protein
MTAGDEAGPWCGEGDGVCYASENEHIRKDLALCGHSTECHRHQELARLERLGRCER